VSNRESSIIKSLPYTELAEIYDHLMDHVNYPEWADYLTQIIKRFKGPQKTILEIACGTGNISIELYKRGYNVIATDISKVMLTIAAKKFHEQRIPLTLFVSSMTAIPLIHRYDIVTCIYDSMNYMKTEKDFIGTLNEIARVTEPEGLFIFDVCTKRNSEMFFDNQTMIDKYGNITYERMTKFHRMTSIQENYFVIHKNGTMYTERHCQKVYSLAQVARMIKKTPFVEVARYDDQTFHLGTEQSERVHFVLLKGDTKGDNTN
jgi:ubiquinone/menaquinone biosynthesis C-methylase UbiE